MHACVRFKGLRVCVMYSCRMQMLVLDWLVWVTCLLVMLCMCVLTGDTVPLCVCGCVCGSGEGAARSGDTVMPRCLLLMSLRSRWVASPPRPVPRLTLRTMIGNRTHYITYKLLHSFQIQILLNRIKNFCYNPLWHNYVVVIIVFIMYIYCLFVHFYNLCITVLFVERLPQGLLVRIVVVRRLGGRLSWWHRLRLFGVVLYRYTTFRTLTFYFKYNILKTIKPTCYITQIKKKQFLIFQTHICVCVLFVM